MIVSIDYDDTWSADPDAWAAMAKQFRDRGHTVIVVTNRLDQVLWRRAVLGNCQDHVDHIIFAGRKPKHVAAKEQGYDVDVWIDDFPESILYGRMNMRANPPVHSTMRYEVDIGSINDARNEFESLRPVSCPTKKNVDQLTNLLLWTGGVMTGAGVSDRIKREAAQLHGDIKEHLAVVTCPQLKAKLLR